MGDFFLVVIIVTSIWVLIDAKTIGVKKGQIEGMGNLGPWGWFFVCLLLWIIGFPFYLAKRPEFKRINAGPQGESQTAASTKPQKGISILGWIGIGFLGLIIAAITIPSYQRYAEEQNKLRGIGDQATQEMTLPEITAADIAAAYDENTVAADQKYKGNKFKVAGTVADINTDFMGDPYITLRGGINEFMEPQFAFEKTDAPQLAHLRKGSKVTLICVGKGDVAKTPISGPCSLID